MELAHPPQASSWIERLAFASLFAFVIVTYAVPAEWIPGFQVLRPALLTSGIAAGATLLYFMGRRGQLHLDGSRGLALIGLCAFTLASVNWSLYPDATKGVAFELIKLGAIYFTVVHLVRSERRLKLLLGAAVLSSIVASVGVIQYHQAGIHLVEGYRARWVGAFSDPNIMAKNLGLIVPLALAFMSSASAPTWMRWGSGVAAALATTAIVLSHSRGGFIGLSAAVLLWVIRERNVLRTVAVALLAVSVLVFAPKSFWHRTDSVTSFHEDASAMGRVHAWEVARAIHLDRPLLGVGAGAFRYAWPLYAPPEARRAYMAHNIFLQALAELGSLGFILFLTFVGGAVGGAFEVPRKSRVGPWAAALTASCVGVLLCDLFSGELTSAHTYLLFGLAASAQRLSLMLAPTRTSAREDLVQSGTALRHADFAVAKGWAGASIKP